MRQSKNKFIFQDEEWWLFIIRWKNWTFTDYMEFRSIYIKHEKYFADHNLDYSDFYETLEVELLKKWIKIEQTYLYTRDDLYRNFINW